MASQRFPNKPMIMIDGKPMIQRVWEKAIESNLGKVIVACCEDDALGQVGFRNRCSIFPSKWWRTRQSPGSYQQEVLTPTTCC